MDWPREVSVADVRAAWVEASWQFSPLAGWPAGDLNDHGGVTFGDLNTVDGFIVALALGVASARPEYWEVQAQVVGYASGHGLPAGELLGLIAKVPYSPHWEGHGGFGASIDSSLTMPPQSFVAAATTFTETFDNDVLNALGYVVANFAGPDIRECRMKCVSDPDPNCLPRCLGFL